VKRVVSRDEGEERSRSWYCSRKGPAAGVLDKKKKKGIGSSVVIGITGEGRGGEGAPSRGPSSRAAIIFSTLNGHGMLRRGE
jgi:hypothetical protein